MKNILVVKMLYLNNLFANMTRTRREHASNMLGGIRDAAWRHHWVLSNTKTSTREREHMFERATLMQLTKFGSMVLDLLLLTVLSCF